MRFSYDAFVLNNKKDAIYYSGPFAGTEQNVVLAAGEVYTIGVVNADPEGTITATKGNVSDPLSASVSGGVITLTGADSGTAGTYTVTLSDGTSSSTVSVKYVG